MMYKTQAIKGQGEILKGLTYIVILWGLHYRNDPKMSSLLG